MSKALRITAGLAALLMGTSLAACSGGGAVATVNGQPISRSTFDSQPRSAAPWDAPSCSSWFRKR